MQQLFIFQGTFLSFWERNSGWPKLQDKVRKIPAANTDSLKFILALIKKNMWIALFFPLIGKINIILHMQMTSAEQSIWDKHTNVSVMYHPSSTHWRELFFFHFLVVCLYYWLYASQSKHETNCLSNLNNKHTLNISYALAKILIFDHSSVLIGLTDMRNILSGCCGSWCLGLLIINSISMALFSSSVSGLKRGLLSSSAHKQKQCY